MMTFIAKLPSDHAIRSETVPVLKKRLETAPLVTGDFAKATSSELKEMAAALVWLADVNTTLDAKTVTALSPTQRATLCRMFKAATTGDVATQAANLLAALGQDGGNPQPPPPNTFLALLHDTLQEDYKEIAQADHAACRALLAKSPFGPAATGSSAAILAKLRESSAMARWCFNCLYAADSFTLLKEAHLAALFAALRVQHVPDAYRRTTVLAAVQAWRVQTASGPLTPDPPLPKSPTTQEAIRAVPLSGASLSAPAPPAAGYAAGGSADPWWIRRLNFQPGPPASQQRHAEHNILSPNCLSPPNAPGASVWEELRGAGASLHADIVKQHGGAIPAELQRRLYLYPTLYIDAALLISTDERSALTLARKAEQSERRTAAPSLASWPWLQDLRVTVARSTNMYDLGRMLSVALRVDSDAFSAPIDRLARTQRLGERSNLVRAFRAASESGDLGAILLHMTALQRLAHTELETAYGLAYSDMALFPECPFMVEIAAGRDCQRARIDLFMAEVAHIVRSGAELRPVEEQAQYTAGAYLSFFEGFNASPVATTSADRRYMQAGGHFAGSTPMALPASGASGAATPGNAGFGGGGGAAGGSSRGRAQSGATQAGQGGTQGGTPPSAKTSRGAHQMQQPTQAQQQQRTGNLIFGVHAPCSRSIVGAEIGLEGPGSRFTCWGCQQQAGHLRGECPLAWGKKGKPLPGFDKDGERVPSMWKGDEPRRGTFEQWVKFLEDSDNFSAGGAVAAKIPGAPGLDAFKNRAVTARS